MQGRRHTAGKFHNLNSGCKFAPAITTEALLITILLTASLEFPIILGITFPGDIEALAAIKAVIDPNTVPRTSCLASWNFSVDPCDMKATTAFVCGIECKSSDATYLRVTDLALDSSGYKGPLSEFVGNLSSLQILDISGNCFHNFIPASVGRLSNLVRMDLSMNNFSGAVPSSIGTLSNLTYLSLSDNALQGAIPATVNSLVSLQELLLYNNHFSGSIPRLDSLHQLNMLDASNNFLTGQFPSELPSSLIQLSLRHNRLERGLPASLSSAAPQLMVLDVSDNLLTGAIDASLFQLSALQQLNLSANQFTSIGTPTDPNRSVAESQLVALDLSYNRISGVLPDFFGSMLKLSALSLRYNLFTGTIPLSYASKANFNDTTASLPLARLFLDGNYLSGQLPSSFLNISGDDPLTASFVLNCLQSCPTNYSFCQGGQRPKEQCKGR